MKHAYLIMAHNNLFVLERLLKLLDDKRNDIYLHVDKKLKNFDCAYFKKIIKKSNLVFIKRMDVRWSCYSQIKCELELLKEATKTKHKYYHLLSGVDMPIKNQDIIHNFFDNSNKEFVVFRNHEAFDGRLERINYYHLFFKNARSNSKFKTTFSQKMHSVCLKLQKKFNINRIDKDNVNYYRDGANWFSITDDLARYIVSLEKDIHKVYKYTYCADEVFLQTIIYHSKFYHNLYSDNNDDYQGVKRLIDWKRGNPYSFMLEDYEEIMNSDYFFVRKIENCELADKIYKKIIQEK